MTLKSIFIFLFCLVNLAFAENKKVDTQDLLKKSDLFRGDFTSGFSWNVTVSTKEEGEVSDREFLVLSKGNNSVAEAVSPKRNKGEIYLFNDRNMWFYKPSLKKPVSISARQRLSGQASNGDIATTHYARDYSPVYEKEENINSNNCAVLLLTSKDKNTTYDKIRYFVSLGTHRAIKAEFLSLQGSLLKTALFEYENKIEVNGKIEPLVSKMIISDAFNKENISTLTYASPKIVNVSENKFNVNNLGK
jgi:outer membrane lipoprotein-sorting protein